MSSASAGQQITEKEKPQVQREASAERQQVTEKLHEQCKASAGKQVTLTSRLLPADLHLINSLTGLVL